MSAPALAVEAHQLSMRYGKVVALDRVDLSVRRGSIFGLLGPNGAGKTTMIKVLTGLVPPAGGDASVAGFSVVGDPVEVKRRIGWVAAEVILDDDLTAWENLWLQAKLQEQTGWQERARDLLRYFGLTDRTASRVSGFSTGMRKKLEIALALLHRPAVVFMDEPTIGLDPATRKMLWELTRSINREFGVTVLLTTHYIEEADALCDTVGILDKGRLIAVGTPAELKARVGGDRIDLETSPRFPEAELRAVEGVEEVRASGRGVALKVRSAATTLPRLLERVPPGSIRRINVEAPSLESAYFELTGSRLDAAEPAMLDVRRFYMQVRRARQ